MVFINIEALRNLIAELVNKETDTELLDLIYKLLLAEG